ncbi:MAG: MotA/TolQ/ExbB proton channel family protein [Bacteroidales bacterium]|nr:MotA/TolQ/ExbB proton channel family protein [Bacteroidales bacterium]MBQ1930314.1 MotA/TolQ/ExbB proton channel family protein [Bacteroidales bacterium]MBQ5593325.1 MotA/TolQ/ExbB proton channel family protein [Bacteroidales bacterium]MBR6540527.1 MotA/TolQ/ExbB proton channel family protein [Bacteroidales bacterium]
MTTILQAELEFSLIDMAFKGGWLMLPLVLLSFVTIYLFSMKLWAIKKASAYNTELLDKVKECINAGDYRQAREICQQENSPIARMLEKGISKIGRSAQDIQTSVENVGSIEIANLEKGLPMMATIAGGAPMIGFLGTVMGMVQAFFNMAQAGSNIDITLLSGGIYTAMVTTVAGLIVGIMAYFGYNFLTSRVSNLVNKMEHITIEFLDMVD